MISSRDWKTKHESSPTYWMLDERDGGIVVGFLTADTEDVINKLKSGKIELQNNDELGLTDVYRRSVNVRPFPLENEQEKKMRLKEEAFEKRNKGSK